MQHCIIRVLPNDPALDCITVFDHCAHPFKADAVTATKCCITVVLSFDWTGYWTDFIRIGESMVRIAPCIIRKFNFMMLGDIDWWVTSGWSRG